jgi:predicted GNAT family acetyltransferase
VSIRTLRPTDIDQVRALLARDPIRHCFVSARIEERDLGDLIGYDEHGALTSILFIGANLVPVSTTSQSRSTFADWLRRRSRRSSSFVGPAEEVLDLWRMLEPSWGPAREIRPRQPVLAMQSAPAIDLDPNVRRATMADLDELVPACVAMFTEEVGIAPFRAGGEPAYRARIASLIRAGHAFVRVDQGRIVFKAEIGSVTPGVCQVQGVWVLPELRGKGMSAPAMASVVALAQQSLAPVVSLYVNDFNTIARRAYERVGFAEVDRFATVLF